MSPTQPIAPEAPFHRAFTLLLNAGRDLLSRLQAAIACNDTTHLPRRFARAPHTAEQRVARTLDWIVALARTLAGDPTWLIVPTYIHPTYYPARYPALTAQMRAECGLPPVPPRTEAQKAAAHRRYVRGVFATQPVAKIAARLGRRLGIPQTHDAWPTDLLEIPQTPAAYAKLHLPSPSPHLPSPSPHLPSPSPHLPSPSPSWGGKGWAPPAAAPPSPRQPRPTATGPP